MKNSLLIFFIFIPYFLSAQISLSPNFSVKLGIPHKVVDAEYKTSFSLDNKYFVALKTTKLNGVFVQVFDSQTTKETHRNHYKDFPANMGFIKVIELSGNNYYYVYAYFVPEGKNYIVAARKINPTSATLEKPIILLNTAGKVLIQRNQYGIPLYYKNVSFKINTSYDKSKVLVYYKNNKKWKDKSKKISCHVFDENMQKEYSHDLEIPLAPYALALTATVSSDGIIYVVNYEGRVPEIMFYKIEPNKNVKQYPLKLQTENISPRDFHLTEDKDGQMACTFLFYGNQHNSSEATGGYCFLKVNDDGSLDTKLQHFFDINLITKYQKLNKDNSFNDYLNKLKIVKVIAQQDGSTILLSEQQRIIQSTSGTSTNSSSYLWANIIISKINADGTAAWTKKIPKRQWSGNNQLGEKSFYHSYSNGHHYIVYLDNPKNLVLQDNEDPATHRENSGGFLTLCDLDESTGRYVKHNVLDREDVEGKKLYNFTVNLISMSVFDNPVFFINGYIKNKQDVLVKIELKPEH